MSRFDPLVKVWLFWEGASNPLDDDVGRVVTRPDALLQRLILDQCGQESWVNRGKRLVWNKHLKRVMLGFIHLIYLKVLT